MLFLFGPRARRSKQEAARDIRLQGGERVFPFVAFVGMQVLPLIAILTPWLDFAAYALPAWAGWLGAALFATGLWLTWRGHRDLGRNWSPTLRAPNKT